MNSIALLLILVAAVGIEMAGPTPQINFPGEEGDKNAVKLMSPIPVVPPDSDVRSGWVITGIIVLVIKFHLPICIG